MGFRLRLSVIIYEKCIDSILIVCCLIVIDNGWLIILIVNLNKI